MKKPALAFGNFVDGFFRPSGDKLAAARIHADREAARYRAEDAARRKAEADRIAAEQAEIQRKAEADRIAAEKAEADARALLDSAGSDLLAQAEAGVAVEKAAEAVSNATWRDTEAAALPAPYVPPLAKTEHTEAGRVTFTKRWVCEIVDPSLVPRQYCKPDQPMLNAAVKSGVREIPGCRIVEVESSRV